MRSCDSCWVWVLATYYALQPAESRDPNRCAAIADSDRPKWQHQCRNRKHVQVLVGDEIVWLCTTHAKADTP
jgi:hypothetical protein